MTSIICHVGPLDNTDVTHMALRQPSVCMPDLDYMLIEL